MGLQHKTLCVAVILCLLICVANVAATENRSISVKKELKVNPQPPIIAGDTDVRESDVHLQQSDGVQQLEKVITISESTLAQLQAVKKQKADEDARREATKLPEKIATADGQIYVEESNGKHKYTSLDSEIPDSFQIGFYFFLALSCAAVLFIVLKLYRMRLTRAERKYGVQGDRTNQELTPLPISIEDANSDDEDQTLYEINRQQIRIL